MLACDVCSPPPNAHEEEVAVAAVLHGALPPVQARFPRSHARKNPAAVKAASRKIASKWRSRRTTRPRPQPPNVPQATAFVRHRFPHSAWSCGNVRCESWWESIGDCFSVRRWLTWSRIVRPPGLGRGTRPACRPSFRSRYFRSAASGSAREPKERNRPGIFWRHRPERWGGAGSHSAVAGV
jgi:hypothetical protein